MSETPSSVADDAPRYRIGAVCRLTGLSQHVLRVWEKRYGVVEPSRSDTDRRLYRESDIARLTLLKTLVDLGQAIGSIAELDDAELQRRIEQSTGAPALSHAAEKPSLAMIGGSMGEARNEYLASKYFGWVGHYDTAEDLIADNPTRRLDVAVIEWPTLHADSAIEITGLANRLNVRHLVLVYDYAPRAALQRLAGSRVTALRSPLDIAALEAVVAWRFGLSTGRGGLSDEADGVAPSRHFDDRQLAYLAAQSSAIACECPMHLAQLIAKLVHFETYSAECESRNAEDAALHAYLYNTTSRARSMMERALLRVVELENLTLPTDK